MALGLEERLKPHVVVPEELTMRTARTGEVLARAPLGAIAAQRYGAPYWVVHRGDLQAALCDAVAATPDIELKLGIRVDDFAAHANGSRSRRRAAARSLEEHGVALVGGRRTVVGAAPPPRPSRRSRALPATPPGARSFRPRPRRRALRRLPSISGSASDAHLVHYPVKGGRMINVVAIVRDDWHEPGWSALGIAHRGARSLFRPTRGTRRRASS